jgi:hypothetical protein
MGRAAGLHHVVPGNTLRTLTTGMALLAACLAGPASAAKYGGGTGTAEYPFLIYTLDDFLLVGNSPDDWDKQFKLMRDIDLSGYDETKLHPIGRWTTLGALDNRPFFGTFDGNGKAISNLKYKDANQEYVGLFQFVSGTIANVKLVRATVIGNKSGTGSLVGYLQHGVVKDCSATDVYVSGNLCVGGLIGRADGGVARCCSYGRVFGIQYVGGLAGQLDAGTLVQCYSKATVVGNHSVGGLVGVTLDEFASVDSCYAMGSVDGTQYVGGLAGQVVRGNLYRCYSTGEVTGQLDVGGVTGSTRVLGEAIGCLWDKETSKQATSPGSVGKTTAEMKSMDTYLATNWNFVTIWTICEGLNYPVLFWQIPRGDLICPDGVTLTDFMWFARNWRHTDCMEANFSCEGADLDSSGAVGFPDLAILAQNWLAGIN